MARPLRIEFAGALYHITSRGNARQAIYLDDEDFGAFLAYLSHACERHSWLCHAYCLMPNHYHLLIETQAPTLSKGMKNLNGSYTQFYNRSHEQSGHLFQGRFKAILVEKNEYLLELARYIVLNPVRTKMVRAAKDWAWSSYKVTAGIGSGNDFVTTESILAKFGKRKNSAQTAYRKFVSEGRNLASPWKNVRHQIYLGSDQFIEDVLHHIRPEQSLNDIPKRQKLAPAKPLQWYKKHYKSPKLAMAQAYLTGCYTLKEIGEYFGVSYATVSRAVTDFEANR